MPKFGASPQRTTKVPLHYMFTPKLTRQIAAYYQNLESDLKGDTGGHFKRLMVSLCSAGRDESMMTNPQTAAADAQALLRAGELRFGTDESTFNMILCQRNHAQLRLVFSEYQRLTGHDIEDAIKSEFSGDIEDGLLAVVRSIKNQAAYFAKCLHKSVENLGTNDRDLIRLVVTRSEIDMGEIKGEYAAKYGESLADAIKVNRFCVGSQIYVVDFSGRLFGRLQEVSVSVDW